jgi:putative membrane protein
MKAKLFVILAAIALVVPFVIAQQTERPDRPQAQERPYAPGMRGQQAAGEQNVGQTFVKNAIQCNMFEQQAAKLVSEKAPNEQVKQFAQKLAEEHQQAIDQLKQVAQGKQIEVPTRMENWQQEKLQAMRQLEPETLQNLFLFATVGGHHTEILMHKYAAQKAQENDIKTLAARQIPTLQQHLQQATRLTEQVTGISVEPVGVTGR